MKRALVTGVSRGIGYETARMLMAEGWHVTGISRSGPPLLAGDFRWISADVGLPHQAERAVKAAGEIDALIHCAGIRGPHGPLTDNDPTAWLATIRTNLLGAYHVTRAALPSLLASDDGRILLFSGGGAFNPSPGYSAYAVAKAGVVSLMETLAAELDGTTVTANCVAPGFVATDIHAGTPDEGRDDDGAMGMAVGCIRHLLSPQARGLTGKTVSAQHDDWPHLMPWVVDRLNDSEQGTRSRHSIQMLARLARVG